MGLFSASDVTGVGAVADLIRVAVDRIWPNKTEQERAQIAAALQADQIAADLARGQMAINQAEAGNSNWWVAGWRPGAGWCCVSGLFYTTVLQPFFVLIAHISGSSMPLPQVDTGLLFSLLTGLLGLGVQRTYEKKAGVSSFEPGH